MEVQFTAEQEAALTKLATESGKKPAQIVQETIERVLHDRARFLAGIERGRRAAARGEFIEHEDVETRIEQRFRS
jgi:predicted transcriptional regulator